MLYSMVCVFRAELFISSRLFSSPVEHVELRTIAGKGGELTDETVEVKLHREINEANESLVVLFSNRTR